MTTTAASSRRPSSRRRRREADERNRHGVECSAAGGGRARLRWGVRVHDVPRVFHDSRHSTVVHECLVDSRRTLVEHSWDTRGTLVEHRGTRRTLGVYTAVLDPPTNTRGTRLGRPRYGKPGARLAILRLVTSSNPGRTWFCIFPSRSQVRVRVVQKIFPSGHGFESRSGQTFEHFCSGHRFESRSCKTLEFL